MPFNDGKNEFNYSYFSSVQDDVCPNGILAPEYDAATVILGDEWRIPTKTDFRELIHNAEHKWITNYQGSRINGILFTSKNNDAELFMPASGYRSGFSFYTGGKGAQLWSSTICSTAATANYAYNIYFNSYMSCFMNANERACGFCLRGVKAP